MISTKINNTVNFLLLLQKQKQVINIYEANYYIHDINDLFISMLRMSNMCERTHIIKTSQAPRSSDAKQYARITATALRTDVELSPLGALRIFHARGTTAAYVVDNGH